MPRRKADAPQGARYACARALQALGGASDIKSQGEFAQGRQYQSNKKRERTRTRTLDPLIKSQLLYQLSYAPDTSAYCFPLLAYCFPLLASRFPLRRWFAIRSPIIHQR